MMVIAFLIQCNFAFAQGSTVSESEVKAIFLFHFTSFVEWPAHAFNSPTEPLVIGILGKNPFGKSLEDAIRGEHKGEHPIVIKYYANAAEIGKCHILFIVKTNPEELYKTLATLKGKPVLTVGDSPYFTASGGTIKFFVENSKVRLQVNMDAVKQVELVISSKLLRVADILKAPQP